MSPKYLQVFAVLSLYLTGISVASSQSGPEFITCTDSIIRLCVQDEGVRLPDNNQIFLGEGHPDASRGSVHVTRNMTISGGCGNVLDYKVELLLEDSATLVELQPWTTVSLDTAGEAILIFDTALSPDSVVSQSGIPYNSNCNEYYTIIWTVIDSCDTEVVCNGRLYLYDCASPITGPAGGPYTAILPVGCFLTLFAKDYDTGSLDDRHSFDDMLFSFQESSYTPSWTVICPPAFGVELPWSIWIADKGEDSNCNGHIVWNERNKIEQSFNIIFIDQAGVCCEPDFDSTLSGRITTVPGNVGISQVIVTAIQTGNIYPTYVTTQNGRYTFEITPNGQPVTFKPEKNDNHKNGVSTIDLVKIQKHLLGRDTLESPYLYIAADVNNSQNVSAIDLIELRKLVLGIYTQLPANTSWRFVRKDYVFEDPLDPWSGLPWPAEEFGSITITDITNQDSLDFYGIKIGDVNHSAKPNITGLLPRDSYVPIQLWTDQQFFKAGDIVNVPIHISSNQILSGFQFTMATSDLEVINILPGVVALNEENFALFGDKATISWFDENNLNVSGGDVLFTVQARAKKQGSLSQSFSINSDITEAELYLENEETFLPVLNIFGGQTNENLVINSITPNPWKEEATVNFFLPEADNVTFTLFDVSGREVYTHSANLSGGHHQHQLKASDFSERGVMFFEINSSKQRVNQKMIVLE